MGSVNIDVHKKERDYQQMNLSNYEVVKYFILYRHKIDFNYNSFTNLNIEQAGDTFGFNEEIIVTYASLDLLIDKIILKDRERLFLKLIFRGYEISDIIEVYKFPKMSAYRILDRIINKITEQNNKEWIDSMKVQIMGDKSNK